MKVFLDDVRKTPNGWHRTYNCQETIEFLKNNKVDLLSLDHDLGENLDFDGYNVLLWIEEMVYTTDYKPPTIVIHSSNPSGVQKMILAIKNINKKLNISQKNYYLNYPDDF